MAVAKLPNQPAQTSTMKYFLILISFILINSCTSQDCSKLPESFNSYSSAVSQVRASSFKIKEKINTEKSGWMKSAEFYSCDGVTGYFIFSAKGRNYIHKGVPLSLWTEFKNADSFGSFYNSNIRGRYIFRLN